MLWSRSLFKSSMEPAVFLFGLLEASGWGEEIFMRIKYPAFMYVILDGVILGVIFLHLNRNK